MKKYATDAPLHRRGAWVAACALVLPAGACATAPAPEAVGASQVEQARQAAAPAPRVASMQVPELQQGDIESIAATGDYWDTGTIASVDDDGNLVYRVPTSLVEGKGRDAYANRRVQTNSSSGPFSETYVWDPQTNRLVTPNALRNRRTSPQRQHAPAPQPVSAPVSAPRASAPQPRPPRSVRPTSSTSRQSRD